jgi:cytochrome c oxidase cbb3-type subunit III
MSDFITNFWSNYVAIITVVSIIACMVLLLLVSRKKVQVLPDNSTGHVWDEDLREMNNPLPRWWVWLFVGTTIFAVGYLVAYPGLGNFAGVMGWSSAGELKAERAQAAKTIEPIYQAFASKNFEQLAADPHAMGIGQRLFLNNCAQCHGSDARGSKGFPNLADSDWLYGGTPEIIQQSITHGRIGQMPPLAAAVGDANDIKNVAQYVLSLSGSPHNALAAAQGKSKFSTCAACHGIQGKGNQAMGAPNLTDHIWLHGWGEELIVSMIRQGKTNAMPAQKDRLTEAQIRLLSAYVWGLSNGATAPQ